MAARQVKVLGRIFRAPYDALVMRYVSDDGVGATYTIPTGMILSEVGSYITIDLDPSQVVTEAASTVTIEA